MNDLLKKTQAIMRKYGVVANKNLGQNFLIDEDTLESIVNCSNISENDLVIEIGPGLGVLTQKLLEVAGKVIVIELDKKMVSLLSDMFKDNQKLTILNEDILKVDLKNLISQHKTKNCDVKIVANLPYYITSPIIMKLLEDELELNSITVMVQKEVAQRMTAKPRW